MKRFLRTPWLMVLACVAVLGFGVSTPVVAESLVKASDKLSTIDRETTVDGAAFVAGDTVTIDGTVKGDLFCAGNTVTVNGTIEGDVLCGGNAVTIAGVVHGDIRVAGNTVTLKGEVRGSATAAGSSIVTDSSLKIGKDLTAGASSISLAGTIGRDVRLGAANATLQGTIGRHVDGAVELLSITNGAKVGGNLTYTSNRDATVANGTVAGVVTREEPSTASRTSSSQASFAASMMLRFFMALIFIVFVLFVALIMPRYVRTATADYVSSQSLFKAAAVGLATFFAILPLTIMAFLSGIGISIGIFLLVLYVLALMVASVLAAYRLGAFMVAGRSTNIFLQSAVGAAALAVLVMIPLLGVIVVLVAGSVGLGMVVLSLASQYAGHPYSGVQATASKTSAKK